MAQTTVDTLLIKIQADMAGLQREMGKVKRSVDSGSKDINRSLSTINSNCLLYTSPSPRDVEESRMPSSA